MQKKRWFGQSNVIDADVWELRGRGSGMLRVVAGVLVGMSIAVAAIALVFPDRINVILLGGLLLLALGQMTVLFIKPADANLADEIADILNIQNNVQRDVRKLQAKIDFLSKNPALDNPDVTGQLTQQIKSLELAVTSMTNARRTPDFATAIAQQKQNPGLADQPAGQVGLKSPMESPLKANAGSTFDRDKIQLYLEPIVDVESQKTIHYRASLAVLQDDGRVRPAEILHDQATRSGYLADLELHLFERLAPALKRLHAKGRTAGVFCPVTAAAFAQDRFIDGLLKFVEENRQIAGYLIIEVSQESLGQLSDKGMSGLAHLAQLGALFSMQEAGVRMPEIATLKSLNFGFIDIDVRVLARALLTPGTSGGTLADELQREDVSVIAASVADRQEIENVADFVKFARGKLYSRPRLVRPDVGRHPGGQKVA